MYLDKLIQGVQRTPSGKSHTIAAKTAPSNHKSLAIAAPSRLLIDIKTSPSDKKPVLR